MRINANAAFYFQTAVGVATAAGGSMLYLGSFGRVCYVPDGHGRHELSAPGLSKVATLFIIGTCFYTGFSLSGKAIRQIFDVENVDRAGSGRLNN